jgi:hypothetical protein
MRSPHRTTRRSSARIRGRRHASLCIGSALGCALLLGGPGGLAAAERQVLKGATRSAPVVPQVREVDLRDLPIAHEWEPGDPIKEIPRRHATPRPAPPARGGAARGADPLLQVQEESEQQAALDLAFPVPILNFAGQAFAGASPPDTTGDVGPNHYIQAVNASGGSRVVIYSKSGSVLAGPFLLDTLGSGGPCASGLGDPVVLYDPLANRWLLSEFSAGGNNLCVYVSRTSDPIAGGWFRYQFTTPSFPDYPKYAIWPDAYYVSTNENNPAAYALDRARMLQGLSATSQRFTAPDLAGFPFQALTPADLDGATPPPTGAPGIFMRHRDDEVHNPPGTGSDFLELWEFRVNWQNPGNSTFTGPTNIPVTDFSSELCGLSSFSCFPQPGTNTALDPLREVVMYRLQYRNFGTHQALAGNLVTDADGEPDTPPNNERGGIRWFELRKTGGAWSLQQEGTYSPNTTNRWMGGSALDGDGNFAVGYNVSSTSVFPGLRYAGRLATDPPGSLPQGEATIIDGSASSSTNRYGDYADLSVDPGDDCTFWFTGEYNVAATWSTRIATFKFDQCGGGPPPPELIVNGGFETSCAPWVLTGAGASCSQGGEFPHTGAGYLQLGRGNNLSGRAYQELAIPAGAPANLTFWLNVSSQETTPTAQNDTMRVEVRSPAGGLLAIVATFSNLDKAAPGDYSQKAFSLAAFAGQTVRLYFRATTNASLPTVFRVDDVSLQ